MSADRRSNSVDTRSDGSDEAINQEVHFPEEEEAFVPRRRNPCTAMRVVGHANSTQVPLHNTKHLVANGGAFELEIVSK